ncbi:MAG: type II secretion system protein [Candidatus Aminicenantes bacterium]|nr:type II secretion system protein [Candidatus Aminicenantes bacterium]MBL7083554.1 type II secretion system protein [Candidatus Aminicenantes bacterium]
MSNKLKQKNKNGFTLIEILIVFSLIGILVGMGLPQFRTATTRAREAVLKENLFQMRLLINQYYADKGKYPASLQTLVDEEYMRTIPVDPITKSSQTWIEMQQTLSEDDLAQNVEVGISDVFSGSEKKALHGTLYSTW